MGRIPGWATGRFFVWLTSLGACFFKVSQKMRSQHLEHNESNYHQYTSLYPDDTYIEHQRYLDKLLFGRRTSFSSKLVGNWTTEDSVKASANSCEVISVHSAMIAVRGNEVETFPRLLELFEKKGAVLGGNAGSSFSHMEKYLKKYGFDAKLHIVKKLKDKDYETLMRDYDTFIISIWNGDVLGEGLHSMCITHEAGQYILHNSYGHGKASNSLKEVIYSYGSNPITLIAVR